MLYKGHNTVTVRSLGRAAGTVEPLANHQVVSKVNTGSIEIYLSFLNVCDNQ